jgi:hypothetical protein
MIEHGGHVDNLANWKDVRMPPGWIKRDDQPVTELSPRSPLMESRTVHSGTATSMPWVV